jgi:hypothetical protein
MRLLISMRSRIPPRSNAPRAPPYHYLVVDGVTITTTVEYTWSISRARTRARVHAGSQQRTVRVYVGASHAAAPQKCQYASACTRAVQASSRAPIYVTADTRARKAFPAVYKER